MQPGKEHPPSRVISAMVWPREANRWVRPNANGMLLWSMMVGQISASSAIRSNCSAAQQGAVAGFGEPGFGEQILQGHGDDD